MSTLTLDDIRQVIREEVTKGLEKMAIQASALGDGRRKMLTAAEAKVRFNAGPDLLKTLTAGSSPKVRAKLVPGNGRGGKVWRYSLEDLERVLGVAS